MPEISLLRTPQGHFRPGAIHRFGKYHMEEERAVRPPSCSRDEVQERIISIWGGCELDHACAGTYNEFGASYLIFLDKLAKGISEYSPEDVARFVAMLPGLYDGDEHFAARAGFFLSALINHGKDGEYAIVVPETLAGFCYGGDSPNINTGIAFLGYENSKDVTVNGNAGWCVAHGMNRGQMRITGSAGDYPGNGMSGGKLIIEGESGKWFGDNMPGGEIHFLGWGFAPSYYDRMIACTEGGKAFYRGKQISYSK